MSIIRKYQEEGTQFDNLKYKPNMGAGHPGSPPLIQKRIPSSENPRPPFTGNEISRRLDDVGRIGQLMLRTEGLKYLSNNFNLNNTIPASKLSRTVEQRASEIGFNIPLSLKDTLKTLGSTLASIPVAGTGTHFIKGSLGDNTYLDFVNRERGTFSFVETKLNVQGSSLPDPRIKSHFFNGGTKVNNPEQALTTKDFYENPVDFEKKSLPSRTSLPDPRIKQTYYDRNLYGLTSKDFRENPESYKTSKLPRKPFATVYLGDPASSKTKYDSGYNFYYKKSSPRAIDQVNAKQPYNDDGGEVPDYVKFVIEILTPEPDSPSTFLQFRAFLDNFSDSYSSSWNKFNYVGRAESFYSYQSFDRNADLSFKVAAATRSELDPIYRKLNHLASATAPTYSGNGIMRGTVTRLTVGDYLRDTPVIINNVDYTWTSEYPWEVASAYNNLPHVLDCRLGVSILHKFTPQTLQSKFINIGKSDDVNTIATS